MGFDLRFIRHDREQHCHDIAAVLQGNHWSYVYRAILFRKTCGVVESTHTISTIENLI
jgi:hypothetical protein